MCLSYFSLIKFIKQYMPCYQIIFETEFLCVK
nr:MAG TPA: protein of unknown function (DUF3412) [Caudoviricetes sp.]